MDYLNEKNVTKLAYAIGSGISGCALDFMADTYVADLPVEEIGVQPEFVYTTAVFAALKLTKDNIEWSEAKDKLSD